MGSASKKVTSAVKKVTDKATDFTKKVGKNELVEFAGDTAKKSLAASTGGLSGYLFDGELDKYGLMSQAIGGTTTAIPAGAAHTGHDRAILEPRRTAEREADQAMRDAEAAQAAAIAARPKDPALDELLRQRSRRGGKRGAILTDANSLGEMGGSGKRLLGL